ncbi:MAG: hypothetical protein K2X86_15120, partial [Cytophagaceae bacterium]|nr:hypothetical protein [Cytophagaceae bacterium]
NDVIKYIGDILHEKENIIDNDGEIILSPKYEALLNNKKRNYADGNALLTYQLIACKDNKNKEKPSTAVAVYNILEIIWLSRGGISKVEHEALMLEDFNLNDVLCGKFPHYEELKSKLGKTVKEIKKIEKDKYIKKVFASSMFMVMLVLIIAYTYSKPPNVKIISPSEKIFSVGANLEYSVKFYDKVENLRSSKLTDCIELHGFDAKISLEYHDDSMNLIVKLSDIKVTSALGQGKYIVFRKHRLTNNMFKKNAAEKSEEFRLVSKEDYINTIISKPEFKQVKIGGSVSYKVKFESEKDFKIDLSKTQIVPNGFSADIIIENGKIENEKIVTFNNIKKGDLGKKSFTLLSGAAIGVSSIVSFKQNSTEFELVDFDVDTKGVYCSIAPLSNLKIGVGGSVSYSIDYGTLSAYKINLDKPYVFPVGFEADIEILNDGSYNRRIILLSNIKGKIGKDKYISIVEGSAETINGKISNEISKSASFEIAEKSDDRTPPKIKITSLSKKFIPLNRSLQYEIAVSDDELMGILKISPDNIVMHGFTSDINVESSNNSNDINKRLLLNISLSNFKGDLGGNKYISFKKGAVKDSAGNFSEELISNLTFNLVENEFTKEDLIQTDNVNPILSISSPSSFTVSEGGQITYTLNYSDNSGVANVMVGKGSIVLNGFTANIVIIEDKKFSQRKVVLTDIKNKKGAGNTNKTISVATGTA